MRVTLATLLQRAVLGLGALMLLATAGAPAKGEIIDISLTVTGENIPSLDEFGDPDNVVFLIDLADAGVLPGSEVIGIGWDVELTAFDPSWLSDLALAVSDSAGTIDDAFFFTPAFDEDHPGTGTFSSPVLLLSDADLPNLVLDDGIVRFEFFEIFDDFPGASDGEWIVNSVVTLRINVIPEPSSVALSLSGLGLLGFVGLRGARRRAASA